MQDIVEFKSLVKTALAYVIAAIIAFLIAKSIPRSAESGANHTERCAKPPAPFSPIRSDDAAHGTEQLKATAQRPRTREYTVQQLLASRTSSLAQTNTSPINRRSCCFPRETLLLIETPSSPARAASNRTCHQHRLYNHGGGQTLLQHPRRSEPQQEHASLANVLLNTMDSLIQWGPHQVKTGRPSASHTSGSPFLQGVTSSQKPSIIIRETDGNVHNIGWSMSFPNRGDLNATFVDSTPAGRKSLQLRSCTDNTSIDRCPETIVNSTSGSKIKVDSLETMSTCFPSPISRFSRSRTQVDKTASFERDITVGSGNTKSIDGCATVGIECCMQPAEKKNSSAENKQCNGVADGRSAMESLLNFQLLKNVARSKDAGTISPSNQILPHLFELYKHADLNRIRDEGFIRECNQETCKIIYGARLVNRAEAADEAIAILTMNGIPILPETAELLCSLNAR